MAQTISVIIPVKNGAATIHRCLQSIRAQTVNASIEIIIADSGSTDGTLDDVAQYNVTIVPINPATFNHGGTRNQCIAYTTGSLLYFTVQDACLADEKALERMSAHFNDPAVMGVTGNQGTPHETDKNPGNWYSPISTPKPKTVQFKDAAAFDACTPAEQTDACGWDNVNAMYRRTALLQQPFVQTEFAEDLIWAKDALRQGWKLVQDPSVVTWHYHYRHFDYEFKVMLTVAYFYYREFHYIIPYPAMLRNLARFTKRLINNPAIGWGDRFKWWWHNCGILAADYKALWLVNRAVKKNGLTAVTQVYNQYCSKVVQGRLKTQLKP